MAKLKFLKRIGYSNIDTLTDDDSAFFYDYAVYGDVGPANKIGEGSIALAAALGVPSSPKSGGVGHGIVYIVFPASAQTWPLSQPEIDQYGAQLFAKWGGVDKAKDCFPDLEWSS